jgi:hypothetical protein
MRPGWIQNRLGLEQVVRKVPLHHRGHRQMHKLLLFVLHEQHLQRGLKELRRHRMVALGVDCWCIGGKTKTQRSATMMMMMMMMMMAMMGVNLAPQIWLVGLQMDLSILMHRKEQATCPKAATAATATTMVTIRDACMPHRSSCVFSTCMQRRCAPYIYNEMNGMPLTMTDRATSPRAIPSRISTTPQHCIMSRHATPRHDTTRLVTQRHFIISCHVTSHQPGAAFV